MRNTYEIRAERFIHQIYDFICDCECVEDYEYAVKVFNYECRRKVKVKHGLTRVVLITSDYVVKIDCGRLDWREQFGGCANEFEIYEQAENAGFAYLFAKPTAVEYKGRKFCVMPRIHGIGLEDDDADYFLTPKEDRWVSSRVFDLHNGNYGWKDGHPVLFDYAASR